MRRLTNLKKLGDFEMGIVIELREVGILFSGTGGVRRIMERAVYHRIGFFTLGKG